MGKFFCFFIINSRKTDTERDGAPHKDVLPHLNGAVSFLFFNLFMTSFVRFAVASTHRRDGAFVVFICICICICFCFYLYLYLYLRWWMHVMGVAYKGSF